jgi:hypothetical protein
VTGSTATSGVLGQSPEKFVAGNGVGKAWALYGVGNPWAERYQNRNQ